MKHPELTLVIPLNQNSSLSLIVWQFRARWLLLIQQFFLRLLQGLPQVLNLLVSILSTDFAARF